MADDDLQLGRRTWRSLEELADDASFRDWVGREFPSLAESWPDELSRRSFVRVMGASFALAGLGACSRAPDEEIVPYVIAPEYAAPSQTLFFATAITDRGRAVGVLAESHEGRPTKLEGNPLHPSSLGSLDAPGQAAILDLYDPDRSQVLKHKGQIGTWPAIHAQLAGRLADLRPRSGRGLRILTGPVTSPTLGAQMRALLSKYPEARWHRFDPLASDEAASGLRQLFGKPTDLVYRFDEAAVVLTLDCDFFSELPGNIAYARQFAQRKRRAKSRGERSRLYAVESTPGLAGASADHRLALPPSQIRAFAAALGRELGVRGLPENLELPEAARAWIAPLVADLRAAGSRALILAGPTAGADIHALATVLCQRLGAFGTTVMPVEPAEVDPVPSLASLRELARDMESGAVELLVVMGANPAYAAPGDIPFRDLLRRVPLSIHLGLEDDETAAACTWHVPQAHDLESWSDARAHDGTATILQPLIAPLYGGRTPHELVAMVAGEEGATGYGILREHWRAISGAERFETGWRRALHDGVVPGTQSRAIEGAPKEPDWAATWAPAPARGLELSFRAHRALRDGRQANNAWLQELPDPITKLTWDNAALLAPATAGRLGLANGDGIRLRHEGAEVEAPVWIVPGQAADCVTLQLGYGRSRTGRVGRGVGFDCAPLRRTLSPWTAAGVALTATGRKQVLACTQLHFAMQGRDLVREAVYGERGAHPAGGGGHDGAHSAPEAPHGDDAHGKAHGEHPSIYKEWAYDGHAWGMFIDLDTCIGCNACTLACQAENNIPVVGREQVIRGREMHWIRVDRYFAGEPEAPDIAFQPVPCMHCENAPCEPVCPVGATVHGSEGLNEMVYNRCVGTRYCSNNCPYKVRRFNFLQYQDEQSESLKAQRNPDVTVRTRGVMEKCTYCVQRINEARIAAKKDGRRVRDGEVVTACEAACPAEAIVFGDVNDPTSRVARLKADPRNYGILTELNTRPRTTYGTRLRNPNPAMGD